MSLSTALITRQTGRSVGTFTSSVARLSEFARARKKAWLQWLAISHNYVI